jgi:DNA polymerase-2
MDTSAMSAPAMTELTGWLFDLYPDPQGGLSLWLLGDDGMRYCLSHTFLITFYAAGPPSRLRLLWRFLRSLPAATLLSRAERRELFSGQSIPLLAVQVPQAEKGAAIFYQVQQAFPDLTYYDADLPTHLRYTAEHHLFPLARCQVYLRDEKNIQEIIPLDTPWVVDPASPSLRSLSLEPDCDPAHADPQAVLARYERFAYRFPLNPPLPLLLNLRALLKRHDPDLLLTTWGDTWLLPLLMELSEKWGVPLGLNRDARLQPLTKPEHSYFSYGQIVYRGRQVHLFGRWHIDRRNALLFDDFGMDGVLEFARVTSLPAQEAARVSPGTGISAMQIVTALRQGILVPWHKQQAERSKSALEAMRRDQGGLIYQPLVGLHQHVAEIDFVSMYPSLMVRFNISPETAGENTANPTALQPFPDLQSPGLVPLTLAPLLEKRLKLKASLGSMPAWDPRRKTHQARASAHKWLLVTCFGYLGYKNARFGRIEAHEAVTAYGREALLRSKEAAEDQGCTVLHMYVDGLWIRHAGWQEAQDFQAVLDEVAERTGLSISLDGIYRWVAFLPSRVDSRVPVANRYFGVFQDGTLKVRGLEARRRDTPPWIAGTQMKMLQCLAQAPEAEDLPEYIPGALQIIQRALADLRGGRIPLEQLLVSHRLSKVIEAYQVSTAAARAVHQLQAAGKSLQPGQSVRFLYTRGHPGVFAWDRPGQPDPKTLDLHRYQALLLRAASAVLLPLGIEEKALNDRVLYGMKRLELPGLRPGMLIRLPRPGFRLVETVEQSI